MHIILHIPAGFSRTAIGYKCLCMECNLQVSVVVGKHQTESFPQSTDIQFLFCRIYASLIKLDNMTLRYTTLGVNLQPPSY